MLSALFIVSVAASELELVGSDQCTSRTSRSITKFCHVFIVHADASSCQRLAGFFSTGIMNGGVRILFGVGHGWMHLKVEEAIGIPSHIGNKPDDVFGTYDMAIHGGDVVLI